MKKIYSLLSVTLLTSFVGFSQVEIFEGNQATGADVSGTTIMINVTTDDVIARTYTVKSVGGASQGLRLTRLRLEETAGWTDGVCWGPNPDPTFIGQCYPASSMNTNPWTTPNTSNLDASTNGSIVVDIHPVSGGCGHYRYYVMDGSTPVDSIDLQVCSTLGVQEQQEPAGMTAYPNPANNTLNINTTGLEGTGLLRITDVLGKVVYSDEVGALKKLDVSEFKNGVYLVTVLDKGQVVQTRRVVIKHQ